MEKERNDHPKDTIVYSSKLKAGKRRTYFFDVRKTKGNDFYLSLTESTKSSQYDHYERHKILLYKEDFNRFEEKLHEALNEVRQHLMPDYDYEAYKRRDEEYEQKRNDATSGGQEKKSIEDEPSW